MHVEFRLSEIAHTCAFDPESFYRMKQLLASRSASIYDTNGAYGARNQMTGSGSGTPLPDASANSLKLLNFTALAEWASARKSTGRRSGGRASSSSDTGFPKSLLSDKWTPQIRVQFVFERLVKMESSDLDTTADRRQHEKQATTNWDGSGIRTKRYSVVPQEVILASLPNEVMDCVIKIRLLQLPPDLGSAAVEKLVDDAISASSFGGELQQECRRESPLCIGVAKITLRELITVRGGVCMALQPKTSVLRSVEALNLNTVATNAMFGKDVGGSSFFTFQVIAFSFGKVSPAKLLLYRERRRSKAAPPSSGRGDSDVTPTYTYGDRRSLDDPGSVSRQASFQPASHGHTGGMSQEERDISPLPTWPSRDERTVAGQDSLADRSTTNRASSQETIVGRFDSAAVRFVLIPYMTLVDMVLRVHDVASWRRPRKTMMLLLMFLLVATSDAMDIAFVVVGFCGAVSALRTITVFYRVPITDTGAGPLTSVISPETAEDSYAYLFGRHNTLLNALVRARLFFTQGLQEDSYFELVLIFHTIRRHQRQIILWCVVMCGSLCLFSIESLVFVGIVSAFFMYPVAIRIPNIRRYNGRRRDRVPKTLHAIVKSWMLGAPMHVSRVVQVELVEPPSEISTLGGINGHSIPANLPLLFSEGSHLVSPSTVAPSMNSDNSLRLGRATASQFTGAGESRNTVASLGPHRRARTMDFDYQFDTAAIERQQSQNAARLSFAVVSFTCEPGNLVGNRTNPCGPLLMRLHRHSERLRYLHDDETNYLSPPSMHVGNLNGGNTTNQGWGSPRPSAMRSGTGSGSDLAGNRSPSVFGASHHQQQQQPVSWNTFFRETLGLVMFMSRGWGLQSLVSPGTEPYGLFGTTSPSSAAGSNAPAAAAAAADRVPLELFARSSWVVEQSPDDGITATLRAMSRNTLTVKKLPRVAGTSNDTRTLALLAAYLLQGSRLSTFSPGPTSNMCAVIIPLEQGSTRFRSLPRPNPCPPRLFQALEEIWRGSFTSGDPSAKTGITINMNTVLQIISAYNDEKNARVPHIDSSPAGDNLTPQQQQPPPSGQAANQLQQKGDPQYHAPRTNFFHTLTNTFTPSGVGAQQQQARGGQANGSPRSAVMAPASSYGALIASREATATTAIGGPTPTQKEPPSFWGSGAPLPQPPPQGQRAAAPPPAKRISKSAPAVSGSNAGAGKANDTGAKPRKKKSRAVNASGSSPLARNPEEKPFPVVAEHSFSTSTDPPALAETHRGGTLNLSTNETPRSRSTESAGDTATGTFAQTVR